MKTGAIKSDEQRFGVLRRYLKESREDLTKYRLRESLWTQLLDLQRKVRVCVCVCGCVVILLLL